MRSSTLFLIAALASTSAHAASYLDINDVTHDPIQVTGEGGGGHHSYVGANLMPGADLEGADLDYANLDQANLNQARMPDASLYHAYLFEANLSFAYMRAVDL